MKLTHNSAQNQRPLNEEYEAFKRQIQRQADGFGLNTRTYSEYSYSTPFTKSVPNPTTLRLFQMIKSTKVLLGTTKKLLTRAIEKRENARAIRKLLSLSDHHLRDIGFDRKDLESRLISNGKLQASYNSHNFVKPGPTGTPIKIVSNVIKMETNEIETLDIAA